MELCRQLGIGLLGFFHSKYQPNQLLGGMRKRDIVVFSLRSLLSEISSKVRVPVADTFGCVVKGIAQIARAPFLHVRVAILELSGLVSRRRHPSIGQQLVRGIKPSEVSYFTKIMAAMRAPIPGIVVMGEWRSFIMD